MIRKDVKLGFAIGGVLLAVLVVYVLVGTGGDERNANNSGAPIVTEDPSQASGQTSGTSHTASPTNSGPTNSTNPHDTLASGGTGAPATEASPPSPAKTEVAQGEQRDPNRDLWGKALNEGLLMSETPTPVGGISARSSNNTAGTTQGDNSAASPAADDTRAGVTDAGPMFRSGTTQPSVLAGSDARDGNAQPAGATTGARPHTIQKNETLAKISLAAYGSANYYPHILRANPGLDPTKLKPGMTITLPPLSEVKPGTTDTAGSAITSGTSIASRSSVDPRSEYRVESNDSLYKIAMKLYGKPAMMDKIYELNKEAIGPDKAKLKLHSVLKLPEPPTESAGATTAAAR